MENVKISEVIKVCESLQNLTNWLCSLCLLKAQPLLARWSSMDTPSIAAWRFGGMWSSAPSLSTEGPCFLCVPKAPYLWLPLLIGTVYQKACFPIVFIPQQCFQWLIPFLLNSWIALFKRQKLWHPQDLCLYLSHILCTLMFFKFTGGDTWVSLRYGNSEFDFKIRLFV